MKPLKPPALPRARNATAARQNGYAAARAGRARRECPHFVKASADIFTQEKQKTLRAAWLEGWDLKIEKDAG